MPPLDIAAANGDLRLNVAPVTAEASDHRFREDMLPVKA